MRKNKYILIKMLCFTCIAMIYSSCSKFEAPVALMTPIDFVGIPDSYASLNENTNLVIPVKFTTPCDSGLMSASYKVVNNRTGAILLTISPAINIPFSGKTVDATITIPVRKGLISVVVSIYDKAGKLSYKSVDIKSVVTSDSNVKTLTNVVMSSDPADNQCFFSVYELNPVFGMSEALTKQQRVDLMMIKWNNTARFISPHAFSASADYYNNSKGYLAGFTNLSYMFITAARTYVTRTAFDAIVKESDLNTYMDTIVIGLPPKGNNYNVIGSDRRVGDTFDQTAVDKGFILGWGYRSHPSSTTVVLNESFALIIVKSVTKKPNGHFIFTFDLKGPAADQRAAYSQSSIAPYAPYPL